jgi:hypothetical protein
MLLYTLRRKLYHRSKDYRKAHLSEIRMFLLMISISMIFTSVIFVFDNARFGDEVYNPFNISVNFHQLMT